MQTNKRPTYAAIPARDSYKVDTIELGGGLFKRVNPIKPNWFDIVESSETGESVICMVSSKWKNLLDYLTKRGIPQTDAEKLIAELATK